MAEPSDQISDLLIISDLVSESLVDIRILLGLSSNLTNHFDSDLNNLGNLFNSNLIKVMDRLTLEKRIIYRLNSD